MIEFIHVRRTYGDKVAVADLTLTIAPGEVFAYLGPNGAGKTTTLKMLVGLLRPTLGTVRICGFDVVQQSRQSHQLIGYVPDEPYLYDKLTGREFLWFIGEVHGFSRDEIRERVDRQVRRFELDEFADILAENYSHGMKQRVAFAAAMLHDPPVVIVDEPMVGLDPRSAKLVKTLLKELAGEGKSVLMSTHSLSVAEQIADRIGIIEGGRLHFEGTVSELRTAMGDEGTALEELYLRFTSRSRDDIPVEIEVDAPTEVPAP